MLQAYIDRAKVLLNGKFFFPICTVVLILLGLTYYFIEKKWVGNAQTQQNLISSEPAAQELQKSEIIVDVSGAVLRPGIYKVASDSRVGDALALAGGVSSDASIQYVSRKLNLAQKINDSEKIYVPFELDINTEEDFTITPLVLVSKTSPAITSQSQPNNQQNNPSGSSPSDNNGSQKTNVNSASLEVLDKLTGIGPAYAQKIIDNRPYEDYAELTTKSGIPKSTLEKIKNQISF